MDTTEFDLERLKTELTTIGSLPRVLVFRKATAQSVASAEAIDIGDDQLEVPISELSLSSLVSVAHRSVSHR